MAISIQPCISTQLDGPDLESDAAAAAAASAEEALSATLLLLLLPPWAPVAAAEAETGEDDTDFWALEESHENSWVAFSRKDCKDLERLRGKKGCV